MINLQNIYDDVVNEIKNKSKEEFIAELSSVGICVEFNLEEAMEVEKEGI